MIEQSNGNNNQHHYYIKFCQFWAHAKFLADRTAARSMIGYWHDTVVCLTVTKCMYYGVHVGAEGIVPIHFFRHFCCRTCRLAVNGEKLTGIKSRLTFEIINK